MTGPPPLRDTVRAFDARATGYDRSPMHHAVAAAAVEAAAPEAGQTLLDVCGGTGLVARAALPRLDRAVVLDASPGMLAQAARTEPRLHLVRADAHHLPLADRSVDLVTCITALHLLHHPQRALQEAARACREDGRVVFTTWAADGWSVSRTHRAAAAQAGIEVPDRYAEAGRPEAARALAERSGLQVDDVRTVRHVQPLADRAAAWERLTGPGRTDAVHQRFEKLLGDVDEHVLLLLTCRPQTSSPSR